ncbi:MAG: Gfo/Idh/MocA family oxidoreductase, partial [Pseudomonadota bacterium]
IATPNQRHRDDGLAAISAGVPALIEKPLADTEAAATELVSAARAKNVSVLVGHHRRHSPAVAAAKQRIDDGALGRVVGVQGSFWLAKPKAYFDVAWRRAKGAGPVLINLIHDIDLLRYLCGEIASVQAIGSNAARGFDVADTCGVLLAFEAGAIGTFAVSDTVVAPWSYELTAGENPAYPPTGEGCYWIGGTAGAMALPQGTIWRQDGPADWWAPIHAETKMVPAAGADPLVRQLKHFCEVVRGKAKPLVSAEEGARSLSVTLAIQRSIEADGAQMVPGAA